MNRIFNSPILKRITWVILLISFGSILTSGLFINYALNRQFQNYLTQSELAREQLVVTFLADIYQEMGGWDNFPLQFGSGRRMFFGNLSYITDSNDQVVLVFRHGMKAQNRDNLNSFPIRVGGRVVGTAFFGKTMIQNLLSRQDELFRATINRSIIWSILITGVISLLVAYIFAKKLSTPITEMNQIARNMTAGNLESRVNDLPQDELGELGNSINSLAERLKQMDELRKKMTADVAHDLRTPLTTIRSHLEGMIDSVIPASRENLESLLEEVIRLISLVNDLQAIVIADTSIQQFKKEPIELKQFLQDLTKKMTPLFQEKGVLLELDDLAFGSVNSDRDALTKIFDNLLTNALKFTPAGKRVMVGLKQNHPFIEITVSDEGVGISEKDLPFIFERFYRTDQSRNRESGGFGLGLTIVKELIEALGGTVTAFSELHQGSIFTVKFPDANAQGYVKVNKKV